MLPNKNHQRTRNSERGTKQFDQVLERLSSVKQLSIADQRTAAINMGKLAALVNPNKPYQGAMQIITASKLSGVKNKRKRFFRLPGEDAPFPCEPGTYNANPSNFISLAKAAGRLISNSSDKALQEKEEKRALHALLLGTSYVPSFMPESLAERSVKGLLEEYASRLAEAIEARTRITQLWEALETTPISVSETYQSDVHQSEYGPAAVFPPELVEAQFGSYAKGAHFEPAQLWGQISDSWAKPSFALGYLMATYELYALRIPEEKAHLFPPLKDYYSWIETDDCVAERNLWLESIGFDVTEHCFRDGEVGRDQSRLELVTVAFAHKVSLGIRKGVAEKVEIVVRVWPVGKGDLHKEDFLVSPLSVSPLARWIRFDKGISDYLSDQDSEPPVREATIGPAPREDQANFQYLFDVFVENYGSNCLVAEEVPHWGQSHRSKFLFLADGLTEPYWAEEDDFEEYNAIKHNEGWIESPEDAKILLGASNLRFIPTLSDAEPEAGAARAGSVAASLLKNAMSASPENRISQLLIDRVALTAEAGLNFLSALLEKSRSAISQI
jgi:hypothetical protein